MQARQLWLALLILRQINFRAYAQVQGCFGQKMSANWSGHE